MSRAKKSPQRLVIGPWTHGGQGSRIAGEVEFTPEAAIDLLAYRLRWYDRWLKGIKNGVDDDPPVLLYVMGTGDDHRSGGGRLEHGGFWRAHYPTSNVFKKGHRIRLDISSNNYPRFDVNPNTGDPLGDYRRIVPADKHGAPRRGAPVATHSARHLFDH